MGAVVALFLAGCEQRAAVELVGDAARSADLEFVGAMSNNDSLFRGEDLDSAGIIHSVPEKVFAELVGARSEFDGPAEHHVASLARAVFFNRKDSIRLEDFTGPRTIDAGMVLVDSLPLRVVMNRLIVPSTHIDTLLGVRYLLLNLDGVGGRGFEFEGNHLYRWNVAGSSLFPALIVSILSPPRLHVIAPTPSDIIPLSRDLHVRWVGGGESVKLVISVGEWGMQPKPIFRFRIRVNDGSVVIPSRILQLLPQDQSRFLFTLASEASNIIHVDGYQDDILVQAITSHSLLLQARR